MTNEKNPPTQVSRRQFVGTVATAAGFTIVPRHVLGGPGFQAPSDKVNVGVVGYAHGMGTSNLTNMAKIDLLILMALDPNPLPPSGTVTPATLAYSSQSDSNNAA